MISHAHIEAIVEFSPVKECPEQLRKLRTNFMENIMVLQAIGLGHDTDSSYYFWIYTIAKNFDPETRKQWELYSPEDEFHSTISFLTAQLFDPRGWSAPLIINFKLFILWTYYAQ